MSETPRHALFAFLRQKAARWIATPWWNFRFSLGMWIGDFTSARRDYAAVMDMTETVAGRPPTQKELDDAARESLRARANELYRAGATQEHAYFIALQESWNRPIEELLTDEDYAVMDMDEDEDG